MKRTLTTLLFCLFTASLASAAVVRQPSVQTQTPPAFESGFTDRPADAGVEEMKKKKKKKKKKKSKAS